MISENDFREMYEAALHQAEEKHPYHVSLRDDTKRPESYRAKARIDIEQIAYEYLALALVRKTGQQWVETVQPDLRSLGKDMGYENGGVLKRRLGGSDRFDLKYLLQMICRRGFRVELQITPMDNPL